ncbi:MAG: alanine racemase [Chloroflexi bacterium]|nr:alanine racemase [Chloroflexota bacterium]
MTPDLPTSVLDAPDLQTPCLVLDLDVVSGSIAEMQQAMDARGVALRPHAKTHKSVAVGRLQVAAGASGLTVGTLGEVEVLVDGGLTDLFLAYPLWADEGKARRLRAVADRCRLRVGVDSIEGAMRLGRAAEGSLEGVLVEVDSGGHRTGVPSDAVVQVARAADAAGLRVLGVFTHGGHGYDAPGASAGAADDEVRALTEASGALRLAGFDAPVRSAGSTPTAIGSARDGMTEERPGTYVYGDRQQVALGACRAERVGLVVVATVVSVTAGRFVLDSGAKTLTKDGKPWMAGYGWLPRYPEVVVRSLSDYHAVCDIGDGSAPALGERVVVVPNHVCPVVDLFDAMWVVEGGRLMGHWPIDARGRSA